MADHHDGYDRRDFVKLAGASALVAGLGPKVPAWAADEGPLTATVGIAKNASVKQAVRDAVELSGGLDFIEDGQRVLIKPNQVGPQWHPVTTNPDVLYEVAKLAGEAGAREIFVSDRCVGTFTDTTIVAKMCRHHEAAMEAQTDLGQGVQVRSVPLDQAQPFLAPGSPIWRTVHHPLAEHFADDGQPVGFQLAELLFQVDHVINVPCAKCHTQLWYTGAMKAFVGMSSVATRQFFHGRSSSGLQKIPEMPGDMPYTSNEADIVLVSQFIAELNLGLAPALNIIDGTRPLHAGSHVAGESAPADVIIASRDRIAADVAEIALLRTVGGERRLHGISPWKHPLIRHARKLGLGVKRMEDLEVRQRGVDEIDAILGHMA